MKSILIRLFVLIVILSIPTYFIYKDYSVSKSTKNDLTPSVVTPNTVPTAKINMPSVVVGPIGGPSVSKLPVPNLSKSWVIPVDYSVDVKRILNLKIDAQTKDLKNNLDQYDKWIDLGILRKTIGDYAEAKNIWEYAASGWSGSMVAYHNLGDLYANFIHDNEMAEKNMLKVVELNPHYVSDYLSLYNLYQKMAGEAGEKTGAILLRGLQNNPDSIDLLMATALHYKEINDKDNARKYYGLLLTQAEKAKNDSLLKAIQSELNNL